MGAAPVERPVASAAYSFVRFCGGAVGPYVALKLFGEAPTCTCTRRSGSARPASRSAWSSSPPAPGPCAARCAPTSRATRERGRGGPRRRPGLTSSAGPTSRKTRGVGPVAFSTVRRGGISGKAGVPARFRASYPTTIQVTALCTPEVQLLSTRWRWGRQRVVLCGPDRSVRRPGAPRPSVAADRHHHRQHPEFPTQIHESREGSHRHVRLHHHRPAVAARAGVRDGRATRVLEPGPAPPARRAAYTRLDCASGSSPPRRRRC